MSEIQTGVHRHLARNILPIALWALSIVLPLSAQAQVIQMLDPSPSPPPKVGDVDLQSAVRQWHELEDREDLLSLRNAIYTTLQEQIASHGVFNHNTGVAYAWLAKVDDWLNRTTESQTDFGQAESIFAVTDKPPSAATAILQNNRAAIIQGSLRLDAADQLFQQAFANAKAAPDATTGLRLHIQENITLLRAWQRRFAEAKALRRQILEEWQRTEGPTGTDTIEATLQLASALDPLEDREADNLYRFALKSLNDRGAPAQWDLGSAEGKYATFLIGQYRFAEAEEYLQRALSHLRPYKTVRPKSYRNTVALYTGTKAIVLFKMGQIPDADREMRAFLQLEEAAFDPNSVNVAFPLCDFGDVLMAESKWFEAEGVYDRALRLFQAKEGTRSYMTGRAMQGKALAIAAMGRVADAEPILIEALKMYQADLTTDYVTTADVEETLATLFQKEHRLSDAETRLNDALSVKRNHLGPANVGLASTLAKLASVELEEGKVAAGRVNAEEAYNILYQKLGQNYPSTTDKIRLLAKFDMAQGHYSDAVTRLRSACSEQHGVVAGVQGVAHDAEWALRQEEDCYRSLSFALWFASRSSSENSAGGEAFIAAQRAVQTSAGEAVSRSGALAVAESSGVGPDASEYESALAEREYLDDEYAKLAGQTDANAAQRRTEIMRVRDDADQRAESASRYLKSNFRAYWDYRSPDPVAVAELQPGPHGQQGLLKANEALVLWLVGENDEHGLVFAISQYGFAWSAMPQTATELNAGIELLRQSAEKVATLPEGKVPAFPRTVAYKLYLSLLGSDNIRRVLNSSNIDSVFVVPTGRLASLPPALLVTEPPAGSDNDPGAIRATKWLFTNKALTILPSVASLRTLRQTLGAWTEPSRPRTLLEFADPDYAGTGFIPGSCPSTVAGPRIPAELIEQTVTRGKKMLSESLANLPSLYGTLCEAKDLAKVLHADPQDVLVGPAATKTNLKARNADGTLFSTRTLAFATHGFVSGDFGRLTEPALALAHPPPHSSPDQDDGLLRASEAATLKLHADWVVLSACNTAAGDKGGEGLSGLARAFFYAGTRTMLVSHWRVRDDATARLIAAVFRIRQESPTPISKAQALQQAMLEVLNDTSLDNAPGKSSFASPSAWAPFVLVGNPD